MPAPAARSARRRASRGSVIVVVLTTLMFAALALVAFKSGQYKKLLGLLKKR